MNEDNFNYTEEDTKLFIVLYILLFQENEMNKNWNEFKSELTYQNRFTSSHPIVEMIHKVATDATYILKRIPFCTEHGLFLITNIIML